MMPSHENKPSLGDNTFKVTTHLEVARLRLWRPVRKAECTTFRSRALDGALLNTPLNGTPKASLVQLPTDGTRTRRQCGIGRTLLALTNDEGCAQDNPVRCPNPIKDPLFPKNKLSYQSSQVDRF